MNIFRKTHISFCRPRKKVKILTFQAQAFQRLPDWLARLVSQTMARLWPWLTSIAVFSRVNRPVHELISPIHTCAFTCKLQLLGFSIPFFVILHFRSAISALSSAFWSSESGVRSLNLCILQLPSHGKMPILNLITKNLFSFLRRLYKRFSLVFLNNV